MKQYFAAILIIGILLASFPLAVLAQETPETLGEAKTFGMAILERLPNVIKDLWNSQAMPLWLNMWSWTQNAWESHIRARVEILWRELWNLTGEKTPDVPGEFQKEKEEMRQDLWERFKSLF